MSRFLGDYDAAVSVFRTIFLAASLLSVLAGTLLAYWTVNRALARVAVVRNTARMIAEGDMSCRVPVGRAGEEISDLAADFNVLIERIEGSMRTLQSVTDDIAHELKTPLTRIRGTVEPILASDHVDPETRNCVAVVVEECDRLTAAVNAMLQLSRFEARQDPLPDRDIDLRRLVEEVAEDFGPAAEDKGIALDAAYVGSPVLAAGDRHALRRMLVNLLDNAIKFTNTGGKIGVSCRVRDGAAEIVVEDSGAGIREDELPRIFDRFYRAQSAGQLAGTGLGLCLVKAVVKAHGGTVHVSSRLGLGTRFAVAFPGACLTAASGRI